MIYKNLYLKHREVPGNHKNQKENPVASLVAGRESCARTAVGSRRAMLILLVQRAVFIFNCTTDRVTDGLKLERSVFSLIDNNNV